MSWDAVKLFVDAQGITQTQVMARRDVLLHNDSRQHQLSQLQPFTTYRVNLTAVPGDRSYRPPATVTVTTQMAAPQPMVQPALYGVVFGKEIQVRSESETFPDQHTHRITHSYTSRPSFQIVYSNRDTSQHFATFLSMIKAEAFVIF